MKKRIFALVLAAVMILSALPTVSAAQGGYWGASGNNVSWRFEDGVLTISGEGDMARVDDLWDEDGDHLGTNAPWADLDITAVVVEEGVTNVSCSAFAYQTRLTTVTLADSVEVIDEMAFEGCCALESVNMPAGLTEIGDCAFAYCDNLTGDLVLPEALTSIGSSAFRMTHLNSVSMGSAVEYIGDGAFASCYILGSIDVAADNPAYDSDEQGALYTEGFAELLQVPGGYAGTFVIPDSVTALYSSETFEACFSLTKLVIPASVTEIFNSIFTSCSALEAIEVDDANPVYEDRDGILYGQSVLYGEDFNETPVFALLACPSGKDVGDFTVPADVELLDVDCFAQCVYLTSVTIPAACTNVYTDIFEGCTRLTGIFFEDGHPEYYDLDGVVFNQDMTVPEFDPETGAFFDVFYPRGTRLMFFPGGRTGFYEVPEGVTEIALGSFTWSSIQAVKFPATLETLSYWSMDLCENLGWLLFTGDKPEVLSGALQGAVATVYYPADNATWADPEFPDAWAELTYVPYTPGNEPVWSDPDVVTGVCGEDLTWVLKDGVLTVSGTGPMFEATDGWEWQPYAEEITGVILEEGVTTVGSGAFMLDYLNLESVSFPSTLTRIDNNAFAHAYALTDVVLPGGLTGIGMNAFLRTGITEIVIPDSVTTLGAGVFSECPALEFVKLPASLEEIVTMSAPFSTGTHLFAGCPSLTTVQMPVYDEGFSLGGGAFADCTGLTDIDFYTGTIIDEEMFKGCTGLISITISEAVTEIRASAFEGCTGLFFVTFEGDAPVFSSRKVFYGDTLTALYPAGNATWTEDVMQNYGGEITWRPYTPNPFTDVPADSFYYDSVMWAIEKGITNGLTADTFGPNATCNRAQVVTFLWRAAGCPEPTVSGNPFVDVESGSFYEKPVLWAVENGITNGADATHFNPTGVCNRAQVVTFLYRAFESPAVSTEGLPFADVPAGSWYEAPIAWAVENGITNGLDATHFGPDSSCNRAQVVTFLYRAYND